MPYIERDIILKSGRKAGYAQLVTDIPIIAPSGPDDPVVIFIPGTPGCRLFNPLTACVDPQLHGARLLILERPGLGLSSLPETSSSGELPHPHSDFPAFFGEFCEAMGLERVGLIGYSAGTPYALAAAHHWQSRHWRTGETPSSRTGMYGLVHSCALVSALAPPFPGVTKRMPLFFKFGYMASQRMKWAVRLIFKKQAEEARTDPRQVLIDGFKPYCKACKSDAATFARPEVEGLFLSSLTETEGRGQWETVVRETLAVAQPWPFPISEIKVPTAIWQGEQDVGTTPAMAHHLRDVIPAASCKIVAGAGHMLIFQVFTTEVLPWVLQHASS